MPQRSIRRSVDPDPLCRLRGSSGPVSSCYGFVHYKNSFETGISKLLYLKFCQMTLNVQFEGMFLVELAAHGNEFIHREIVELRVAAR